MAQPAVQEPADDAILWDVIDEHLAEAGFLAGQLERSFESPRLTLKDLARGLEPRLLAHVDGLVIGGPPVRARRLDPLLKEPSPDQAEELLAAALVIATSGAYGALSPALGHEAAEVRAAAQRALTWMPGAHRVSWLAARLGGKLSTAERASLLEVCARCGVRGSPLVEWLQHDDPALVGAALRACVHAEAAVHRPAVEHLLEHGDAQVKEAALVPALAWGSSRAWSVCTRLALDPAQPHRLPMTLYAALGGPAEHDRLANQLERPTHVDDTLAALGHTGSARMLPQLLAYVEGPSPHAHKLAVLSIALITGLDPATVEKPRKTTPDVDPLPPAEQDPEAQRALPPLEQDDLDADLAPAPEDDLPDSDPAAVRAHCEQASRRLVGDRRWLAGKPFAVEGLLERLREAPLGVRHALALVLFVRSGGTAWLATRALSIEQRAALSRLSASGPPKLRAAAW